MRPMAHRNASTPLGVQPGMTGRKVLLLAIGAIGVMVVVPMVALLPAANGWGTQG